jgi:hypothetical protein
MADDLGIEVTLSADNEISAELKDVQKEADKATDAIEDFGDEGSGAVKQFQRAMQDSYGSFTELKSMVDLVNEGVSFFSDTIGRMMEASRLMRGENDLMVQGFADAGDALTGMMGALGDIGILMGEILKDDFQAISTEFQQTMIDNRETILQSMVIIFKVMQNIGNQIQMVFNGISASINTVRTGLQVLVVAAAKLAKVIGDEVFGGVEALDIFAESSTDTLKDFAQQTVGDFEDMGRNFLEAGEALYNLDDALLKVTDTLQKDPGKIRLKNQERITAATEKEAEAKQKALDAEAELKRQQLERLQRIDAATTTFITNNNAAIDAAADMVEQRNRLLDELMTIQAEKQAEAHEARVAEAQEQMDLIQGFGEAFAAAALEATNFQQGLIAGTRAVVAEGLKAMLEAAKKAIMAEAVKAAASASSSAAALGPLAMAGAGVAAFTAVQSLLDRMPKMASGGMITGGVAGRDSVPVMAMPGEYIMSTDQVDAMRTMFSNMGLNGSLMAGGGSVPAMGKPMTININSTIPPSRAQMTKLVRQSILPAMADLRAQGVI